MFFFSFERDNPCGGGRDTFLGALWLAMLAKVENVRPVCLVKSVCCKVFNGGGKRELVGKARFFPKKIATDRAFFTPGKIGSAPPKGAVNNRVPVAGEQSLTRLAGFFTGSQERRRFAGKRGWR